ncbi:phosphoribosylanthranilate isomerase [uncultured Sphingosinicella sp.]|jgi:phosphoribosylanthranilate isomerase|uniref:phosphoribosylanthranilate isomerase n=1 Tax=uncultured Sphingosinicella sp. TaxID=478748 RepID=UPI0030D8D1D1|tara:strand:- start:5746 stop:6396 length:651 start_codon:yes stop_codon:yes gene_type:complete
MARIKICGVRDRAAIDAAAAGRADYVGFVFFAKSPRNLSLDEAGGLAGVVPSGIRRIGLFVNADDEAIGAAVRAARLDGVQLHGDEGPDRAAAIKGRFGVEVWKALPVTTRADLAAARSYAGVVDRILFDAKTPPGAALPGGMGVRFDWRLLARDNGGFDPGAPWGLAGGLDASTVGEALATTQAPLVDVSSGVEDAPGVKSPAMIRAFCEAVRAR